MYIRTMVFVVVAGATLNEAEDCCWYLPLNSLGIIYTQPQHTHATLTHTQSVYFASSNQHNSYYFICHTYKCQRPGH